jgi:zinc protease
MESIAKHITELELADGARVFIAPTKAKDVVTVQGSVLGGWNMLPRGKGDVQTLTVELLDAGTKTKSKDQIRELLSTRGISLKFSPGGDRTFFYGSCLPEDLGTLLDMLVECLSESVFPAKELALAKTRLLGDWEEARTDTHTRASLELLRSVYEKDHLNYPPSIEERIASTKSVERTELLSFKKLFGRKGMIIAIVGDVPVQKTERAIRVAIGRLPEGSASVPEKRKNAKRAEAQEILVPIKDKANIDVFFGASVPLTMEDLLYIPYIVFNNLLGGGGFSNHLMRTIREREGLTYGIRAQSYGFMDGMDGAFRIWATFSPETFKKAVTLTLAEMNIFVKTGLTPQALQKKQDQLTGSYVVGLSTTNGLASRLLSIGIEGKLLSYIDTYPDLIRAVTVEDLKAVAKLIPFNKLSLAASGTFDTKSK